MRSYIFVFIFGIMLISLVSAETETYNQNDIINLQYTCSLGGSIPSNSATFNVTIFNPLGKVVVNNQLATAQGNGKFNYTFQFLNTRTYKVNMACIDGAKSYTDEGNYEITGVGNTLNKGITETSIFMIIALIVAILVFLKVSKFFGSMLIFVIGFAVLFINPNQGYIGWIIIGAGFLMIMYALLKPKKSMGRQIRW